ncbi:unnamed protein product [Peronospora belbahrii]|nr:unnamed protein product [Peronospora belbahrii]
MTWLVKHNVCPTCRYQLPTQTEPTTAQAATQTTPTATIEPEQEPNLQDTNVTGVRRQRPSETSHPRDVRQRVNEPTLALMDEDAEMDVMLEQEAERFVKEEMEQHESVSNDDGVEIHDCDVEEFMHETSSN